MTMMTDIDQKDLVSNDCFTEMVSRIMATMEAEDWIAANRLLRIGFRKLQEIPLRNITDSSVR